ncbi:4'-phosphopantetheinyl transferase superfamily protein [Candidatus Fukatsuia symbiotica]|uniref:4'-phosphopantetheinyl transferase family protein n=1 Tax=Candidatus Fukatsuia TaxID=1927833 RepID=UPI000934D41E
MNLSIKLPFIRNFTFSAIATAGMNKQYLYSGLQARCHFDIDSYQDALFDTYHISFPHNLHKAVLKRRAEFLAGRFVAQQVLNVLGVKNFRLENGADRAPQWPVNIIGSISHNDDTALCAALLISPAHTVSADTLSAKTSSGIGLDIESWLPVTKVAEIWPNILGKKEYFQLQTMPWPFNQLLTLVFSAKESLFKALYPQVGCYFDFLDACLLNCSLSTGCFELQLLRDLSPEFHAGRCFQGCFNYTDKDVQTSIVC